MVERLPNLRRLDAVSLGQVPQQADPGKGGQAEVDIAEDDPRLVRTQELLLRFGGVIFVGPPGTSKTYYAQNIALVLAGLNQDLVRFVQFHPSYQYEDFVEGYVPNPGGGFQLKAKHLLELVEIARDHPDEYVVLVIDELSRGDPGRIFGEALTYVEKSKRDLTFFLSSGTQTSIPRNLVFLCTMNPLDRGVDEVDAAFERRFAKIAMDPDEAILEQFLEEAGMAESLRTRVRGFFTWVNRKARDNPFARVGHTFFLDATNEEDLQFLWEHQLRFLFEKAYQLDPQGFDDISRSWQRLFEPEPGPTGDVAVVGDTEAEQATETPGGEEP